jgi:ribonuclease Z
MVPTKERNHQSIFIPYKDEGILIDCGEGTQRQLKIANIKPTKITRILISHWHGDHVLGLPGLLQTLNASEYEKKLYIYGPIGTIRNFELMLKAFSFNVAFEYVVKEIKEQGEISLKDLIICAKELVHSVPCLGFSIREKEKRRIKVDYIKKLGIPEGPLLGELQDNKSIKWKDKLISPENATYLVTGRKVTFILDTVPCKNASELAKDSDLLVSEAVYTSELFDKAVEYKHMTCVQAAQLAAQSNVKKLVITHFSQRYKTAEPLLEDAKTVFSNTVAAFDFMKIRV